MSIERRGFQEFQPANKEMLFWKGPDIATTQPSRIPARGSLLVPLRITPENIQVPHPGLLSDVHATMRSRVAQVGLDISDLGGQLLHDLEVKGIDPTEPYEAMVRVDNFSNRVVDIPEETGLLRAYYENPQARLTGEALYEACERGDIHIAGEQGKDWHWAVERGGKATGMYVKIDEGSRRWSPPQDEPLRIIDDPDFDYRAYIDSQLEPVPYSHRPVLWIGETQPKITLSENVNGILHSALVKHVTEKNGILGAHINFHLIDGGRTDWGVRVEVVSPTDENMPDFVLFRFVAAA